MSMDHDYYTKVFIIKIVLKFLLNIKQFYISYLINFWFH